LALGADPYPLEERTGSLLDDGRLKATDTVDGEPLGEGVGNTVPEALAWYAVQPIAM
jgi:hypothetical protein